MRVNSACLIAILTDIFSRSEFASSKLRKEFASNALFLIDSAVPPPDVRVLGEKSIGIGTFNRLTFFAPPSDLPLLLAPLVLRELWKSERTQSVVFAYPYVPEERISAAHSLLHADCEAVLLRSDNLPPSVLALARNARTERMVTYWADCIERFTPEHIRQTSKPGASPDSQMVEYLCDKIASIRLLGAHLSADPPAAKLAQCKFPLIVRDAIANSISESELLFQDPVGNAESVLNEASPAVQQDGASLISRLMSYVWSTRPDLKQAFDLSTSSGRHEFTNWYIERAAVEFNLTDQFIEPVVRARLENVASTTTAGERLLYTLQVRKGDTNGFNLVGYPRAEMGMGEQLRNCAGALECARVPFCITDFHHGLIASNRDQHYQQFIHPHNPYVVNLFHINADQIGLAREKFGAGFFRDHYNIGYWEWELSEFPHVWASALDQMDEIWAPSQFIAKAISEKTTKPVIWMPLPVEFAVPELPDPDRSLRSQLGLPEKPFLFLFAFDFSSFASRKNYPAIIEAFHRAFLPNDQSVALIIKVIRHAHHRSEIWDLLRAVGDDQRIQIIDRVLRKQQMRQLIAACNCFISLHRSEGFGLTIAEAMYLGKPVIVTNYSGNTDFTRDDNSCLVDYRLIPVEPGEYVYNEGQVWAEPDVDQAASYMRRLTQEADYRTQLGRKASSFIQRQHSCRAAGRRYADRLKQIVAARKLLTAYSPLPSYSPVDPS